MLVPKTFVAINHEEMHKKDFASKYFLEVNAVVIRTACHHLRLKVLKPKDTLEKFITNAEAYLEPCQISRMEFFGLTIFAKKLHHRFSIGF